MSKDRAILHSDLNIDYQLRVHDMKANGVQITVKDNTLSYRQYQMQLPMATQSPMEIASAARHLFENNYDWHTFVRAVQEGYPMRTVQIKCNRERRLFDTIEGSKLKILIKCSNTKVCPYKSDCLRTTEIVLGAEKEAFDEFYKAINCPHCGKRLFDVTTDSVGIVTIKCEMCGKVATIPVIADQG